MLDRPTAPLTPRSQPVYGTPRSARRTQLVANATPSRPTMHVPLAPLAPLSLRPYPSHPYANDAEFEKLRQDDRHAVDDAVERMRERHSYRVHMLQSELSQIDVERRKVEEACLALKESAVDLAGEIEQERKDAEAAREQEATVAQRARKLKADNDAIQESILEVTAKLEARRALKAKQKEAWYRQTAKNGPEIDFFEQKLGLKIRGLPNQKDIVQFKFANIDPGNYNRVFSLNVNASQLDYSVLVVSPSPSFLPNDVLRPLVANLNKSRDLYGFLRDVRAAFKHQAGLE